MLRYLFLFLLPLPLFAQEKPLDIKGIYEKAITEYIIAHPEDVVTIEDQKLLFIRKEDYLEKLKDTLQGVRLVLVAQGAAKETLEQYLPVKKKFILLHIQQAFARSTINFIYIYPMKTAWNPKKERFVTPEYTDRVCKMDFEYKLEDKVVNYYFKGTTCTEK